MFSTTSNQSDTEYKLDLQTINISSIQVHSRNEAMQQHYKHENDSVHWYVFGEGDVWKNPRGDQGMFSYHPPAGCSGFRAIFRVRNFSEVYRALPGRKKGGCGDAENRTPDVRFKVYLSIVFAKAKSSIYSLSDWYSLS